MYDSIVRMAHVLNHLGVKSNDVVGLSSENSVEFSITMFAAFAVNATVAPLNVTYSSREVDHAINLSKPKVIFASQMTLERVAAVAAKNSFVKKVIGIRAKATNANILPFWNLMEDKNIPSQSTFECVNANKGEDVALIVCSSGTTGMPKGVQLTQSNILITIDSQL